MPSQSQAERPGAASLASWARPWLESVPQPIRRVLALLKVDLEPVAEQPPWALFVLALVIALLASLASDAILVAIGTTIFPSVRDFPHFQFSDYGKLTVIGVTIACLAWPVVTRISSQPRWLFLSLAAVVTLLLWAPDLWILVHGEPLRGVGVLMLMHLAIAFITYNALVRIDPASRPEHLGRRLP